MVPYITSIPHQSPSDSRPTRAQHPDFIGYPHPNYTLRLRSSLSHSSKARSDTLVATPQGHATPSRLVNVVTPSDETSPSHFPSSNPGTSFVERQPRFPCAISKSQHRRCVYSIALVNQIRGNHEERCPLTLLARARHGEVHRAAPRPGPTDQSRRSLALSTRDLKARVSRDLAYGSSSAR
ncbi:hypothetical protein P171DRAFT_114861 [Karstenula rhodostoma CBS 690.94]|uniref:Uncharacterized protein n=1 Tax=Karstenula rhodostoma CBS 690.94 TaxID=1392251 RepID=A0A9P4P9R1_9PLEO|nr:hypothetical protein P171DRAFT_114861 [Karstenula rhodostoma CBS 690.94]